MRRSTKDVGLAVGLILFFLFTLFFLIPKGIYVPANINIRVMSPDFFPRVVAIFLIMMCVILALQSILSSRGRNANQKEVKEFSQEGSERNKIRKVKIVKICVSILFLFIYFKAVKLIGMLPSSCIFLLAFSSLYGERRFKIIIPLAIILPLMLYFFFTQIAKIPLPKGIIFD